MTSKKSTKQIMAYEWKYASLTISGKNLNPKKVTRLLGVKPDSWAKRGDHYGKNRRSKQGFWVLEGGSSNWRLETQLKYIFKRIASVKHRFKKIIKEDVNIKDVYLTIAVKPHDLVAVAGYYINSEILNKFTSLGIGLALSIHVPAEFSAEKLSMYAKKVELEKD